MRILFILSVLIFFQVQGVCQTPSKTSIDAALSPYGFLENVGQVRDLNNNPVSHVLFQAKVGEQQVFITKTGLSILLAKKNSVKKIPGSYSKLYGSDSLKNGRGKTDDSLFQVNYEMERFDITLKNAYISWENISTRALDSAPLYNFYYESYDNRGAGIIPQKEVVVKNIYQGIDWKVYITQDDQGKPFIKYDFIIHPGADYKQIRLKYSDNAKLELADGELIANGNMGIVKELKPYSYIKEDNVQLQSIFVLKKNELGFQLGKYDPAQTVVIDPSIFWLTYLSSTTAQDYYSITGNDIETDSEGNIFVQLSTSANTPFPVINLGNGAYFQDVASSPNGSMLLLKFAPGGQLLWSTYFGSTKPIGGWLMTIDSNDNIVAIGAFANEHSTIPLLDNGGYFDASQKKYFITKFNNSGVLLWSSFYFDFSSYPTDLSFDENGNVFIVGWSSVWGFPVVDPGGGAYVVNNAQFGHAQTIFISQFNANNELTWSTRIEGNDYDPFARVCADKNGNVFVAGNARSTNLPLVDAGGYFNNTDINAFVCRFNSARQMTWLSYIPVAFGVADITTDDDANLYLVATRYIFKFNPNTELLYQKSVPDPGMHFWQRIMYDPSHDQLQLLGFMNDSYYLFSTLNTACNGTFYNNGLWPNHTFPNATGPIFATITPDGDFTYRSLVDWVYEYYEVNEMSVDPEGNPVYIFGYQKNAYSTSNPQLTNPGNGAYFDDNCCYQSTASSALLLKLHVSELEVDVATAPANGCQCDGSIDLTPTCGVGPFSYQWSTGATSATVNNLCPGNYEVRVTDANNLTRVLQVSLPYPPGSAISTSKIVDPENCNLSNGSILIQSVNGGVSPFEFSIDGINYSANGHYTGLTEGSYIVRIKDANGCVFNDTTVLNNVVGPAAIELEVQQSSCIANDGQVIVTGVHGGEAPYTYTLTGVATNTTGHFTDLETGQYSIIIEDAAGCQISTTSVVPQAQAPVQSAFTLANDHCSKGIGFISVNSVTGGTGPYTYSVDGINFTSGNLNGLNEGNYDLFIKDQNGCVLHQQDIIIENEQGPDDIVFSIEHAVCGVMTGNIRIEDIQGGFAPFEYSIDGTTYSTSPNFNTVQPGNHLLFVRDAYGCTFSKPATIEFKSTANISLHPKDTVVCYNEKMELNARGDLNLISDLTWNIPSGGASALITVSENLLVTISGVDQNNCIVRDTATIIVKSCSPPEKCLLIPTAFTPNNDGSNDFMGPVTNGCQIQKLSFRIYNRWGEQVFESADLNKKWNGSFKGMLQPADVYVFYCVYTTEDNVVREQKGTFVLLR